MGQRITHVGEQPLAIFNARCLRMAQLTAADMHQYLATQGSEVQVERKSSYAGVPGADVMTSADSRAQGTLVTLKRRFLPSEIGEIGEEGGLRRESVFRGYSVDLTFDPLDGTARLIWLIEHGQLPQPGDISVMIGVQFNRQPVAGYICDVATLSTYCREPYGASVMQVGPTGETSELSEMRRPATLRGGTLLWHGRRDPASPITQRLMSTVFKGRVERGRCSIGLTVMGVFGGKYAVVLRPAGTYSTPWDDTPLQAMVDTGEVVMLRVDAGALTNIRFMDLTQNLLCDYDILYVHSVYLGQLARWARSMGVTVVGFG